MELRKRILALDIGTKRIGVAISDVFWMGATPIKTISRKDDKTALGEIEKICKPEPHKHRDLRCCDPGLCDRIFPEGFTVLFPRPAHPADFPCLLRRRLRGGAGHGRIKGKRESLMEVSV